jgi:hypothetical protein
MTLQAETGNGILRVRIRPRINSLILFSSLLILLIIIGAGLLPAWKRFEAASQNGNSVGGPILSLLLLLAMAVGNVYAVLKMFLTSELIVLNQTTIEIQRRLLR